MTVDVQAGTTAAMVRDSAGPSATNQDRPFRDATGTDRNAKIIVRDLKFFR